MGLMELGCTRQGFGRDVQPATPNRPRCWALVGFTLGAILVEACQFAQRSLLAIEFGGFGGEPVGGYRTPYGVLRKLHPLGGGVPIIDGAGETWRGSAETIPGWSCVTMMMSSSRENFDGGAGLG